MNEPHERSILIVDDEPDLKSLVVQKFRRQIRDGAVSFTYVHDGVQALATLKANSGFDLLVTDINMPRMDGLTLLQKLHEADDKILTVIISAYGDMANIRTAMNRGAFDFLTKPIDFSDFEATIAKTIRHVELLREAKRRQEENERLQSATQNKSRFLANVSHELRTPLNAILGYTELILDKVYEDPPDKMRDVLQRIDKNGKHLLGLINDVLDLSKMEAGQEVLTFADYSIEDVLINVKSAVASLASGKGIRLEISAPQGLPVAHGDERKITQVLLNLVGNAIKFTDQGAVEIEAAAVNGSITVSVRDSGPGISEADQAKIFEEFEQAQSSATRAKGGTGLGLTISKRIVELHGGRVWVDSQLGNGATFSFAIPIKPAIA